MKTQPLFNIESPSFNPHEVEPIGNSEKIAPYGKEKKESNRKKAPDTKAESMGEKRIPKEIGKGDIIDLEA